MLFRWKPVNQCPRLIFAKVMCTVFGVLLGGLNGGLKRNYQDSQSCKNLEQSAGADNPPELRRKS
jgi:hypothetical protein